MCPRRAASRSPAQSHPWPAAPGPWGSDPLAPCPCWVAPRAVTPSAPASGQCSAPSRCWIHQQRCVAPLPPPLHRPEGLPLVATDSTQSSTPWHPHIQGWWWIYWFLTASEPWWLYQAETPAGDLSKLRSCGKVQVAILGSPSQLLWSLCVGPGGNVSTKKSRVWDFHNQARAIFKVKLGSDVCEHSLLLYWFSHLLFSGCISCPSHCDVWFVRQKRESGTHRQCEDLWWRPASQSSSHRCSHLWFPSVLSLSPGCLSSNPQLKAGNKTWWQQSMLLCSSPTLLFKLGNLASGEHS